jgi:glycine/D-amino acid oxidase-like deaminating enzyme
MSVAPDVLVAGAGIVGCAVALEAARAGLRVAVAEPRGVGGGATGAAMGHLVVIDDDPHELALCRLSLGLWQEFLDEPGVEHAPTGTLWVASDGEEAAAAEAKRRRLLAAGVAAEWLDPRALAQAEPLLRPGLAGALRVPGDAVVYPPGAALTLLAAAERLGARLVPAGVRALDGGGADLTDGTRLHAGSVVLACGTATTALAPSLPVVPRKGHLVITDRYPGLVRHQLVELGYVKSAHATGGGDSVAMNVQPRPSGQLLIGSSRQFTGDEGVDLAIVDAMIARALGYLPGLRRLHALRVWWGFRPAPADGRPFIGACPGRAGVWLATGHEGLGITTSLATARLVVDQILGRPSAIDAAPFAPARAMA